MTDVKRVEPLVVYLPFVEPQTGTAAERRRTLVARFRTDRAAHRRQAAELVAEALVTAPAVVQFRTINETLAEQMTPQRLAGTALGLLGAMLAGVALLGGYVVASSLAARSRRDLAIRAALGASPMRLVWSVFLSTARPFLIGIPVGLLAVGLGAGVIRGLLFGVTPREPTVLAGVTAAFAAISLLSILGPTVAALQSDVATSLRE